MGRSWRIVFAQLWLAGVLPTVLAAGITASSPACAQSYEAKQSWTDSISSGFKQGINKIGRALNPKPVAAAHGSADDPVSLNNKAKPSAELYVAMARLYEQSGKWAEAEQQYQLALKINAADLPALLGYARLKEQLDKPADALQLYQQAVKSHPNQASVYNNLGLYYARRKQLDDAVAALNRAVQLDSKNPLYRNNIATVLVDRGDATAALKHLRAVHEEAAANYNMGYLLNKKGQPQEAIRYFSAALQADPSMDAAQVWIDHLQRTAGQARLAQHPSGAGVRVTTPPPVAGAEPQSPEDDGRPQRLPAIASRRYGSSGESRPVTSCDSGAIPDAPLPPALSNPAIQPLPRVN